MEKDKRSKTADAIDTISDAIMKAVEYKVEQGKSVLQKDIERNSKRGNKAETFPVGAVYETVSSDNPSDKMKGIWTQINDVEGSTPFRGAMVVNEKLIFLQGDGEGTDYEINRWMRIM